MYNYSFAKQTLDEITIEHMKMAASATMISEITTIAPLGCSGDDYVLFGRFIDTNESEDGNWHRESLVSFRNYCGRLEMFIADTSGNCIIYTKFDGLEFNALIEEYYRQFCLVKPLICATIKHTFEASGVAENAKYTAGFELLKVYAQKQEESK